MNNERLNKHERKNAKLEKRLKLRTEMQALRKQRKEINKKHLTKWHVFKGILGIISVFTYILFCWSLAYFLTPHLYDWFGSHPHAFAKQLINSVLGFFLFGVTISIVGRVLAPRRLASLNAIIDGIKRIAKGDFTVQLPVNDQINPFSEIVTSINSMAVELSQLEQMRQEFISNVSHEIQSPLTSISGFAKVLQGDHLTQVERVHYLGIIEAESLRLAKLSENLLKLTSLESEHHPFDLKIYRLDKQLRKLVLACEPLWVNKSIEMDIELEELQIQADEDLMSQVWINLINNSIKFTPEQGTIKITSRREMDMAIIEITDSGMGIAEADLSFIFDRFYKADKSRDRTIMGSGLGLSIVKKIITMHQGNVHAESQAGEWTKITVQIPLEQKVVGN